MSGQIIPALEKEGFTDVVIFEDKATLPAKFEAGTPNLKLVPDATHWASGTYQGADGAVKNLPSQLRELRDDGLGAPLPPLPPLVAVPVTRPPWALPTPVGGTGKGPAEGLSTAAKFGIAALLVGAAFGIGIVVIRASSSRRETNPRRRRRRAR